MMLGEMICRQIQNKINPPECGEMELWRTYSNAVLGEVAKNIVWFLVKRTIMKFITNKIASLRDEDILQRYILQASFNKFLYGTLKEKKEALAMFRNYYTVKCKYVADSRKIIKLTSDEEKEVQ